MVNIGSIPANAIERDSSNSNDTRRTFVGSNPFLRSNTYTEDDHEAANVALRERLEELRKRAQQRQIELAEIRREQRSDDQLRIREERQLERTQQIEQLQQQVQAILQKRELRYDRTESLVREREVRQDERSEAQVKQREQRQHEVLHARLNEVERRERERRQEVEREERREERRLDQDHMAEVRLDEQRQEALQLQSQQQFLVSNIETYDNSSAFQETIEAQRQATLQQQEALEEAVREEERYHKQANQSELEIKASASLLEILREESLLLQALLKQQVWGDVNNSGFNNELTAVQKEYQNELARNARRLQNNQPASARLGNFIDQVS